MGLSEHKGTVQTLSCLDMDDGGLMAFAIALSMEAAASPDVVVFLSTNRMNDMHSLRCVCRYHMQLCGQDVE